MSFNYPPTRRCDQTDIYHDTTVADPYRWLEDPNSDETKAWVDAQNEVTFGYLRGLPAVEPLKQRLTELWNYERYSVPFKRGGRYFYYKNDGLQNQAVLYTQPSLEAEPVVLLDPNTLSTDGTVALGSIAVSEDGCYLAYSLSSSGSDWLEWKVRDIETRQDTTDHLKWSKFSGAAWTHDNQGFFYSRYAEPAADAQFEEINYFQKLFYHRLGTSQSEDTLIYEHPDEKEWGFRGQVTSDGHYLIISVWRGTEPKNLIFYQDLQDANGQVIELISEFEASYYLIDNDDTTFWFKTDLAAPRGRVIALDLTIGNIPQEIIPEADETLKSVSLLNHQFVVNYLKDAYTSIQTFDLQGHQLNVLELPGIGSAGGFDGKKDDIETFYQFASFTVPSRIYRYNLETGEQTLFRDAQVAFDPNQYETRQVFYPSKDGTQVPMFLTHKKGLIPDGKTPTLLYGYGGFNISLSPNFSVSNLVWLELGGIYAVANLRGGGEYGETWHQAGTKLNKQNVFDDFISAADWLIDNQYTTSQRLAIMGGSNGGLLVGACMIQRPDLFAAVLPAVGVMDMLRFNQFTIGWAWESDYGSPQEPDEFKALYSYSPLHNLTAANYPATLITTADHDDRVVPAHSFKFAAALQAVHQGDNPVMIRIDTKAGHGSGKPTVKIIEEVADKWAFLVEILDIEREYD